MVEFLLGLIGILILILSLDLIARFVREDFDAMIGARTELANNLVGGSRGNTAYGTSQSYGSSSLFYNQLVNNIEFPEIDAAQQEFPPRYTDVNGFEVVAEGDPMSEIVGVVVPASVSVESSMFSQALGRDRVRKVNAVWMPPWDDLMGEAQ